MPYTCPVCQGSLIIERIDDGVTKVRVEKDNTLTEISCSSNGSIWAFCEQDKSHKIPQELQDKLFELFEEEGY